MAGNNPGIGVRSIQFSFAFIRGRRCDTSKTTITAARASLDVITVTGMLLDTIVVNVMRPADFVSPHFQVVRFWMVRAERLDHQYCISDSALTYVEKITTNLFLLAFQASTSPTCTHHRHQSAKKRPSLPVCPLLPLFLHQAPTSITG